MVLTTLSAHQVPRSKLFDQLYILVLAVGTDESDVEIRSERLLLDGPGRVCSECEGGVGSHGRQRLDEKSRRRCQTEGIEDGEGLGSTLLFIRI